MSPGFFPIARTHVAVELGGGMLVRARFVESGLWWGSGFSDDVSHILVGDDPRSLVRVMTRGLDMCVLEGSNSWSLPGSGCESFAGVRCTGFVDGD